MLQMKNNVHIWENYIARTSDFWIGIVALYEFSHIQLLDALCANSLRSRHIHIYFTQQYVNPMFGWETCLWLVKTGERFLNNGKWICDLSPSNHWRTPPSPRPGCSSTHKHGQYRHQSRELGRSLPGQPYYCGREFSPPKCWKLQASLWKQAANLPWLGENNPSPHKKTNWILFLIHDNSWEVHPWMILTSSNFPSGREWSSSNEPSADRTTSDLRVKRLTQFIQQLNAKKQVHTTALD